MYGYDPDWELGLTENDFGRYADYSVAREQLSEEAWDMLWTICEELNGLLKAYYLKAVDRLKKIVDGEIDYHNSDEYIAETLAANDWLFDEDGEHV